jgi:uncharacterized protein
MSVPAGTGRNSLAAKARKGVETAARADLRERYRVDLPNYHADCDANYLRLCKLMPELERNHSWRYQVPGGTLEVAILERSRYTTEVCLQASADTAGKSKPGKDKNWLRPPPITVRMYHDARMAEVVAVDGQGPVGGDGLNFSYPNPAMHKEDERQQVNRYLSEWLAHCLANGRADVDLTFGDRRR